MMIRPRITIFERLKWQVDAGILFWSRIQKKCRSLDKTDRFMVQSICRRAIVKKTKSKVEYTGLYHQLSSFRGMKEESEHILRDFH